MTSDHRRHGWGSAAERHVHEVETERQPKLLANEVRLRAGSCRREIMLSGIGLDEGDELLDASHRQRRIDHEHGGGGNGECYRLEILDRVERKLVEQGRIDHERAERNEDGISIRCRPRRLRGAHVSRAACEILDVKLPVETLAELLRN